VERRERRDEHGRRAVRVADDRAAPAALAALAGDEREVVRVDLGHEERHVVRHPES